MRTKLSFLLLFICFASLSQNGLFDRAETSYVLGKYEEALSIINKKIRVEAEANDHLLRALIHQALDNRSNAQDDFLKCIEMDVNHLEAYYHFAQFLINSYEYGKAVTAYDIMIERLENAETKGVFFRVDRLGEKNIEVQSVSGMESEIRMNRGLAFQGLGRYKKALEDYNAAILLNKTADKLVNRANLLSKMNQKSLAIEDLKAAIEIDPRYGLAWYNLFILDTSTQLPTFLKNNEEFGPMLSARAVEAVQNEEYPLAEKLFKHALTLLPNDDLLLTNSGRLDLRNGFNKQALEKLKKAQELNPDRSEVLYLIGNAYFGLKKYENAIEYYQSYLKFSPTTESVWYNLSMVYLKVNKNEKGCSCLKKAESLGATGTESYLKKYCTK